MNKTKITGIILISFFLALGLNIVIAKGEMQFTQITPITIFNNKDISYLTTNGNGTINNPYIIQNFIISSCNSIEGIQISETNDYLVLNNITLINNCKEISIFNVSNIVLDHISLPAKSSLQIYYVNNLTIENSFSSNIVLFSVQNGNLSNNQILSDGIENTVQGSNITIENNSLLMDDCLTNFMNRLFMDVQGNKIVISNNNITQSSGYYEIGLGVGGSNSCFNCQILYNKVSGFNIGYNLDVNYGTIKNNEAIHNTNSGFQINYSSNSNYCNSTDNKAINNSFIEVEITSPDVNFGKNYFYYDNYVSNNEIGYLLNNVTNQLQENNTIENNFIGIYFVNSYGNTAINNHFSNNRLNYQTLSVSGNISNYVEQNSTFVELWYTISTRTNPATQVY